MKTRLYSLLKFAIGWPLTIVAFLFIAKLILDQSPTLMPHLHSLNVVILGYGIVSFVVYYILRSYIWFRILKAFTYKIHFRQASYLWAMSELKRYIPGNVWSFLGRAVLFGKEGVDKKDIGKGLVLEAELFVLGSLIVSLLALPFIWPGFNAIVGAILSLVVFVGSALFIYPNWLRSRFDNHKKIFLFLLPPFNPEEHLLLTILSASALFFFGLGNYLVICSAFMLDPQFAPQFIGVFVLAFVTGYLSIVTPAGFGVREGIVIVALSKFLTQGAAAFAALFSRLILIIAELVFISISYLMYKVKTTFIKRIETWCSAHPHALIIVGMALIFTIYFSAVSFLRYDHFYAGRFDLGNMAQTVWNTAHGNFFMMTDPNGTEEVSRLAFHADFLLALLAPFYWIWPDPRMLLLVQTIIVAAGAFFAYLLAVRVLKHKNLALILAFAYLLNPSVERANIYDFHAATLVMTFLFGTFYFYLKKQYKWFAVFAVLAALCKEQIWLIIGLFGIFLMIHHKKWLHGALVFFLSVGIFYYIVAYAIPAASPKTAHFALEYFADFGDSPAKIIRTIIFSPQKTIAIVFEKQRIQYLKQLFSPLGYLSLLAPVFLIFTGPDLLINLLSNNSQLHQIYYQYTAGITPFIFIAAIFGIWVLQWFCVKHLRISPKLFFACICCYVLYFAVMTAYHFGPLPGSREPNLDMFTKHEKNQELINNTLVMIPSNYTVASSNNIGSHLSDRKNLYVLPLGADKADFLVFLLTSSERGPSFGAEQALQKKLMKDPKFKVVVHKDEFSVFERK